MTSVGQIEKRTQRRVVKLFREALGYDYLGDWTDREGNASVESDLLRERLRELKRMKTKWGACNAGAGRVWLNLELAKKPPQCLEYLVVHELMHLIERRHDDRFVSLMDEHLPQWRHHRKTLNEAPLSHADWTY